MKMRLRLGAVVLGLLLPALALASWMAALGGAGATSIALPELPRQIGPWTMTAERELEPLVFEQLQPDEYLVRRYEAPKRTPIWVYVAVYGGRASYGSGAHDPQVCYPAQGWEIVRSEGIAVPLAALQTLSAKIIDAQNGNTKQVALYWFQPAERWPLRESAEQLIRIIDAIVGRPQYAFVRLSAPSGPANVRDDLVEFATRIAWPVRAALSTTEGGSPTVDDLATGFMRDRAAPLAQSIQATPGSVADYER